TSFDAPDATSTCTRRMRSNTPLQSLLLLNDEGFMEFAQALAARVLKEAPADDSARINYVFHLCASRKPAEDERLVLLKLLDSQSKAFAGHAENAMFSCGKYCPEGIETTRFAPWVIVARAVLNLDET